VAATQQGLFGYLTKPYDAPTLIDLLKRATQFASSGPETGDANWRSEIVTASRQWTRCWPKPGWPRKAMHRS